ncbi:MAG: metallophosphoesterase [Bacteroidales bacterium]|nr:metallophosphoesterase [Bacteroidales bacterium]
MKKKQIYILIIILVLIAFFFTTAKEFPKNVSRLPFFFILMLLDAYLWFYVRRRIKSKICRSIIAFLYWLPLMLLVGMVFLFLPIPYQEWDKSLKIYLGGIVFIMYAAKVFPIITLLLDDVRRLFQFIYQKIFIPKRVKDFAEGKKISRSKFLGNIGLITGGIAFSGLLTGILKWAYDFRVRKEIITVESLPKVLNGLRIVQISDIHLGSWTSNSKLEEVVQIINDLKADLVFFTGDLVDYVSAEAYEYKSILEKIRSRHGVFSVLGNHDYGDYATWESAVAKQENMIELFNFFNDIGWKLLRNENSILEIDNEKLAIIGIENWSVYDRFPKYGDLDKALPGTEGIPVKLLLSHDPTFWDHTVQNYYPEIDITFSGHTHGFQLGVEIPGFKWSPAQYLYKQWAGLYSRSSSGRKQYLYVNRGTGTIGYPGRIGILPEITLFELSNFSKI